MNGAQVASDELVKKLEAYQRREKVYLGALIEQEVAVHELKQMASVIEDAYGDPKQAAFQGALIDPVANMEVLMMRRKFGVKDAEIASLQEDIKATKFDPKTEAGQKLMKKCRVLLEENKELGEQLSEGKMAEMRHIVAIERSRNAALREKCLEGGEFCKVLNGENETLQNSVARIGHKLLEAKSEVARLQKELSEANLVAKQSRRAAREAKKAESVAVPAIDDGDDVVVIPGGPEDTPPERKSKRPRHAEPGA